MVSFLDVIGIKPCPDLSPNQNALRISSGTELILIRKEDTAPLTVVQFLCSLHHCKRWRRWSTFNYRQRSGRCRPRAATTNLSNSCTCGLERFPSARNDTFIDSELCSYTGDASSCSMAIVVTPFSPSSVVVERKNFLINFNLEKLLSPLATLIGRVSNILRTIPIFGAKSSTRIPAYEAVRVVRNYLDEREGTGCRNSSLSPPSPMGPALENTALNTNE
ncbi:hypothetical protein TNCV_4296081 [Trichonephila clavipes]|nr:hypothetical protein TNCV_4296081 [Trichonephila clavipes]